MTTPAFDALWQSWVSTYQVTKLCLTCTSARMHAVMQAVHTVHRAQRHWHCCWLSMMSYESRCAASNSLRHRYSHYQMLQVRHLSHCRKLVTISALCSSIYQVCIVAGLRLQPSSTGPSLARIALHPAVMPMQASCSAKRRPCPARALP